MRKLFLWYYLSRHFYCFKCNKGVKRRGNYKANDQTIYIYIYIYICRVDIFTKWYGMDGNGCFDLLALGVKIGFFVYMLFMFSSRSQTSHVK